MFEKAQKSQIKLRLAVAGPSGSGKTYSSLLIASGLGSSIALVDTENKSSTLYSELVSFDVATLKPPFSVERYIACIEGAEKAGYEVLIVDSLSHAWIGEGGLLDMHSKVTKSTGNSFGAWGEVTPYYNKLIDKIHQCNLHLICCLRAKSQYVVEDNSNGRKTPRKVGLEPEFRPGGLFEFDICLHLNETVASVSKDRSGQLENFFTPTVETGQQLKSWLTGGNSGDNGKQYKPELELETQSEPESEPDQELPKRDNTIPFPGERSRSDLLSELANKLHSLGLSSKIKEYELYLNQRYSKGLKDLDGEELQYQINRLTECQNDEALKSKFVSYLQKLAA